ncbi:hypothetical protein [Corallococcus sp. M7]
MSRKTMDCREAPGESNCSLTITGAVKRPPKRPGAGPEADRAPRRSGG